MSKKVVEFLDGFSVEVEQTGQKKVSTEQQQKYFTEGIKKSQNLIIETSKNIADSWGKIQQQCTIDGAEIEVGLAIGAEGSVFFVKGNTEAHLKLKIKISPLK